MTTQSVGGPIPQDLDHIAHGQRHGSGPHHAPTWIDPAQFETQGKGSQGCGGNSQSGGGGQQGQMFDFGMLKGFGEFASAGTTQTDDGATAGGQSATGQPPFDQTNRARSLTVAGVMMNDAELLEIAFKGYPPNARNIGDCKISWDDIQSRIASLPQGSWYRNQLSLIKHSDFVALSRPDSLVHVRDLQVLLPAQAKPATYLPSIAEQDIVNEGQSVAAMLLDRKLFGERELPRGVAISQLDAKYGTWQYQSAGCNQWKNVGSVSDSKALVLQAQDRLRFVPDGKHSSTPSVTLHAWNGTGQGSGKLVSVGDHDCNSGIGRAGYTVGVVVLDQNAREAADALLNDAEFLEIAFKGYPDNVLGIGDCKISWADVQSRIAELPKGSPSRAALERIDCQTFNKLARPDGLIHFGDLVARVPAPRTPQWNLSPEHDAQGQDHGQTVAAMLQTPPYFTGRAAPKGIAIHDVDSENGTWQFQREGTQKWEDVGLVGERYALLVGANDRLRFVPNGPNSEPPQFSFHVWNSADRPANGHADVLAHHCNNGIGVAAYTVGIPTGAQSGTGDTPSPAPVIDGPTSPSVAENTRDAGIFTAKQKVSWTLSGADKDRFTIGADGKLSFKDKPDFENPTDADRDNSYQVTVIATDPAGNKTEKPVTVSVTDVSEGDTTAPVITGPTSKEVAEGTTAVEQFKADENVTWSLSGPDKDRFTIGVDGSLSFKDKPDFENPTDADRDNSYQVTVIATDPSGNKTEKPVTVKVADVQEGDTTAPVITGPETKAVNEGTTAVEQFKADENVTWSLSGPDKDRFTIGADGSLSFKDKPDFENPADADRDNSYQVTVIATDPSGNKTEKPITVSVTDVPEGDTSAPVITGPETKAVNEGTTAVEQFKADENVTWSLSGPDKDRFTIGADGRLSFKDKPDFENPTDADGNNSYQVTVIATDPSGNKTEKPITVSVADVPEGDTTAPVITGPISKEVAEGTTAVEQFKADENVTWTLSGPDKDRFTIGADGKLSFKDKPDFENPTDADGNNSYQVTVIATDPSGNKTEKPITVSVADVPEGDTTAPVITGPETKAVNEGTTAVEQFKADENVTWTLSGPDKDRFTIGADGSLSFKDKPDFENPTDADGNNSYQVTVIATDPSGNKTEKPVTVSVTDVPEGDTTAPVITGPETKAVNEGTTAVEQFKADENVTWTLSGPDKDRFTIGADGKLSFKDKPDFENPTDADGNNSYQVTVIATDPSGNKTEKPITVKVADVPEGDTTAPVITGPTSKEVNEGTTAVEQFKADENVTWSLSGPDKDRFTIGADGKLSFKDKPDFENPTDADGNNSYQVTVIATDPSGNKTEKPVTVKVADVPEGDTTAPVITGPTSKEVSEGTTAVEQFKADENVTWSLSGPDKDRFTIGADGSLSFKDKPDFENPTDADGNNSYQVTVIATDPSGNKTEKPVTVSVTDVPEGDTTAPVITGPETKAVNEGTTAVEQFKADENVTWTLSGPDKDRFTIGADGSLSFKDKPDFENPTDADGNNSYQVTVIATDPSGNKTEKPVTVKVADVPEGDTTAPVITGPTSKEVSEGTTAVEQFKADENVTWSLSGADKDRFTIGADGKLSFKDKPDFENPTDADGNNSYQVTVIATDPAGNKTEKPITVKVADVPEGDTTAPVITGPTSKEVNEGTTAVEQFKADENVTWSLSGPDKDRFTIGADGKLSFKDKPDFENPTDADGNNSYQVTVIATDPSGNKTEKPITVSVADVPEGDTTAPVITGPTSKEVAEGTTAVEQFKADENVTWSLSGPDKDRFTIGADGRLSFKDKPDFENPTDADGNNSYQVTVIATDPSGNKTEKPITVKVADVPEGDTTAPVITGPETKAVNEGTTAVEQFKADENVTWSLSGADKDRFTIGADGSLSFKDKPDFENPADADRDNSYQVTVIATDPSGNKTEKPITVSVDDMPEGDTTAPVITGPTSKEVAEGTTAVEQFKADENVTWTLSGPDKDRFTIGADGSLSFKDKPDFENPTDADRDNSYQVTVIATDPSGNKTEKPITVSVADMPEGDTTAPVITGPASKEVNEGTTAVEQFKADEKVTWTLGGADKDRFTIGADGSLSFKDKPDFENPTDADRDNSYQVTVIATDPAGNKTEKPVTVSVTDMPEGDTTAPVITGPETKAVNEGTTAVEQFKADENVTWTLSGPDKDRFTIGADGSVSFKDKPDFENPTDADGNNSYQVTVIATDPSGNKTEKPVTVKVADVPEGDTTAPVITGPTSKEVNEGTTAVEQFKADENVTWSLSGADKDRFTIGTDGSLSFVTPPDYAKPTDADGNNQYQIDVVATDPSGNTSTKAVTVEVKDLDTTAPVITGPASKTVDEGITTPVEQFKADEKVTWTLGGADKDRFTIGTDGSLSFVTPPDYAKPTDADGNNQYQIDVVATDPSGNTSTKAVTVEVKDLDTTAPVITGPETKAVDEGITTPVEQFKADEEVSWTLSGADKDRFTIGADGSLSFVTPPDYAKPTDADGNNQYQIDVVATDPSGNTSTKAVTVEVKDLDTTGPTITGPDSKTIDENTTAVDAFVADEEVSWSVEGPDGHLFAIDAKGNLSFVNAPDYENPQDEDFDNAYQVVIVATDTAGNQTRRAVPVNVRNVPEPTDPDVLPA